MEELSRGSKGCSVKLSSYGSKEHVELHVELENRSRRALSLALGSFAAGSSNSCILAGCLQSSVDGTWQSACILQPRGYTKQRCAMFLPAFQAVKLRILGQVVQLGRCGSALRVGGDVANAAEVLLPLGDKPLLRFVVGKPVKTLQDPKPVWIGPHEAQNQPRKYSTFEKEICSEVCELTMDHPKIAPKMQTRRLQALQHSLSPELPIPKHHEAKASLEPSPRRSTFSGFCSARLELRGRPNTVPAVPGIKSEAHEASESSKPSRQPSDPKGPRAPSRGPSYSPRASPLPSLTVIHHSTTWRNLGRRQDVLADPVLLELAEAVSGASHFIALIGRCFRGRLGQRFADALRALGYKVILGNASLVSWVSAHEDSKIFAELVLVAHWKSLQSSMAILQSTIVHKAVVLCDHCDQVTAMAEAKVLPCSWQVVPSLLFNWYSHSLKTRLHGYSLAIKNHLHSCVAIWVVWFIHVAEVLWCSMMFYAIYMQLLSCLLIMTLWHGCNLAGVLPELWPKSGNFDMRGQCDVDRRQKMWGETLAEGSVNL